MDAGQQRRLTHYFLNSDTFLWGLGNGWHQIDGQLRNPGRKNVYQWLFREGFWSGWSLSSHYAYVGNYAKVKQKMVEKHGIEKITEFIYSETKKQFGEDNISILKLLWESGTKVKNESLKNVRYRMMEKSKADEEKPVKGGCSFFDIDNRYEGWRWSKFAAIFFEEILPFMENNEK